MTKDRYSGTINKILYRPTTSGSVLTISLSPVDSGLESAKKRWPFLWGETALHQDTQFLQQNSLGFSLYFLSGKTAQLFVEALYMDPEATVGSLLVTMRARRKRPESREMTL